MIGRFWNKRAKPHALGLTFMSRLARDTRGNVLAIVGASILPLLCMIGSGIDVSRSYMAEARLQQACDAASLAGRRAMTSGEVDDTVRAEATKFFNFNFPQGSFQTAAFVPNVSGAANQTVVVTASTTIPTTIMKIFGFAQLPLSVTCNAKQDFVNTDIVLVLDSTGSMLCATTESSCSNSSEKSTSKIKGLRSAVLALYDQLAPVQTQLESAGLRLRYGVVPYSSGVNIGKIVQGVDPSYIVSDEWNYQTRVGNYNTPVYAPSGTPTVTSETYGSNISSSNCSKYGYNQSFSGFSPSPSGEPIVSGSTLTYYLPDTWGGSTNISGSGNKTCIRTKTVYPRFTTRYKFTSISYQQDAVATNDYVVGNTVKMATLTTDPMISSRSNNAFGGSMSTDGAKDEVDIGMNGQDVLTIPTAVSGGVLTVPATVPITTQDSASWAGCIEERDTVKTITASSGYTIPSGAYDLNASLAPSSNATRWRPYWPDMVRMRSPYTNNQTPQIACPAEARRLQAWTRTALSSYLDTLIATGGTYHDNGMIWGARMLATDGIFSSDNPTTYGGMPVSRFIIFMTDGMLDTGSTLYSTYGMEYWDLRTLSSYSDANNDATHLQRFRMMCNATKSMGVSIWVVAFASALDSALTECASNAQQASTSADTDSLIARFTEIGKNIGALRLTQ